MSSRAQPPLAPLLATAGAEARGGSSRSRGSQSSCRAAGTQRRLGRSDAPGSAGPHGPLGCPWKAAGTAATSVSARPSADRPRRTSWRAAREARRRRRQAAARTGGGAVAAHERRCAEGGADGRRAAAPAGGRASARRAPCPTVGIRAVGVDGGGAHGDGRRGGRRGGEGEEGGGGEAVEWHVEGGATLRADSAQHEPPDLAEARLRPTWQL